MLIGDKVNLDLIFRLYKFLKIFTMKNADEFFDKTREMADQAEEKLKESFEKAKKSETYEKISGMVGQVGDFVEKKIEELKESDIPGKAERLRDQAEAHAESAIEKARAFGAGLADEVEEVIDSLKGKKKQT